jgi:hypothetical protein
LINGNIQQKSGIINIDKNLTIATSFQVVLPADKELTVQEFFRKYYPDKTIFNIDKKIAEILDVVNLKAPLEKHIKSFSG